MLSPVMSGAQATSWPRGTRTASVVSRAMRLTPKHWHNETWICSIRGHVAPAAGVARLTPGDHRLGFDADGRRFARCLRCDVWLEHPEPAPDRVTSEHLPPVEQLPHPRRAKEL